MASTDPEIKDHLNIPVWMRTKPAYEFEPFAASPPAPEDSFFYIRYPKTNVLFNKQKMEQDLSKVLNEKEFVANSISKEDWGKQTKPCPDLLHGIAPINITVHSITSKTKSAGTDDAFKGEGASSAMNPAHLVAGRSARGFAVAATPCEEAGEAGDAAAAAAACGSLARRGSRSLPATPAHSPPASPSRRRKNYNRYFTSPFEPVEDGSNRSWLTMALLGYKKDLATSTSTLAEEDAFENRLGSMTLAESVESLGPAPKTVDHKVVQKETSAQPKAAKSTHSFRPKPSELREMNFWSPTSM